MFLNSGILFLSLSLPSKWQLTVEELDINIMITVAWQREREDAEYGIQVKAVGLNLDCTL